MDAIGFGRAKRGAIATPWKFKMEPKNVDWEDDLPFQLGDV